MIWEKPILITFPSRELPVFFPKQFEEGEQL